MCCGPCGSCPSAARQQRYSDLIRLSPVRAGAERPLAPIGSPNSCEPTEERCARCWRREHLSRGALVSRTVVFDPGTGTSEEIDFHCRIWAGKSTRLERKHKRALTTILPEERRPNRLFTVGSEQSSAALKSTPTTNFRFSDSCE